MKFEISKENANIIKGIAVVIMFFHHFCGFPESLDTSTICKGIIPFSVSGISLMRIVAVFGSICVGIFTMLSGYIWAKVEDKSLKKQLMKCKLLLCDYWVIMLVFIIFGIIFSEPFPSLQMFIMNLFGFGNAWSKSFICVTFGWYIGFYLLTILLLLSLHKFCDKHKCDWLLMIVFISFFVLKKMDMLYWFDTFFADLLKWGPLFSIAYLIEKYDVLSKVKKCFSSKKMFLLSCLTLFFVFGIKCIFGADINGFNMYILYTPPFWIALVYIVDFLMGINNLAIKGMFSILDVLGKYSMNLWLLHGIFFTPNNTIQFVAYLPQYGVLVVIWSFVLLLPIAIMLKKIQDRIKR